MLIVLAYHLGDRDMTVKLFDWMSELGREYNHDLLVIRDHRAAEIPMFPDFISINQFVIAHDTYNRWPESANLMFEQAARWIEQGPKQPWLWLEPDSVPMSAGWLDAIEKEYLGAGKPFMGDFVHVPNDPNFIDHMSGVGVYPGEMTVHAGLALIANDLAWDIAAAKQIIPKMHRTKLIQHVWNHPAFASIEDLRREIRSEAVLVHKGGQPKDTSIIDLLRGETGRKAGSIKEDTRVSVLPNDGSSPSAPIAGNGACDIFIKTHPADYPWLDYCIRSIDKFCTGFRQFLLVIPEDSAVPVHLINRQPRPVQLSFQKCDECEDGYLGQQVQKLYADQFLNGEHCLHVDSDTIFTKSVTPQTFFTNGKINWMMTPYSQLEGNALNWKPITEKFLGRPVEFEFMRRFPFVLPRWIYVEIRKFCEGMHDMTIDKYVMSQPYRQFSEFNALGAFAYYFHKDKFNWLDTNKVPEKDWPELVVDQRFSYGGLTPQIREEWDKILGSNQEASQPAQKKSGGNKVTRGENTSPGSVVGETLPPSQSSDGFSEMQSHVKALRAYAKDGFARMRVIRQLKLVGLIPKKK